MANNPKDGHIDIGQTLLDMNNLLGRLTQLTADTSNDVKDIKVSQKSAEMRLANVEFKVDDLQKDMTSAKSAHAGLEARTTAIEQKDRDRANKIKGAIAVWSIISAFVMLLLSNLGTVIEFVTHFWQTHESSAPITPPDP